MVAWMPAITHLSPMGTVLAVHHRCNVGGGQTLYIFQHRLDAKDKMLVRVLLVAMVFSDWELHYRCAFDVFIHYSFSFRRLGKWHPMGNSFRPTIIIQKPSISNQLTSIYEVFICADYHDLIFFRQPILDRNPLLRRYAIVSPPVPCFSSSFFRVVNIHTAQNPAITFIACNRAVRVFLVSVAKHKANPTIGTFSIRLVMQIPFIITYNKANFTTTERARFEFVFRHCFPILPAAPSIARPSQASPHRTIVRPARQAQQPRSGQ